MSYLELKSGEIDPNHGVKIKYIVEKCIGSIVYIDVNNEINWCLDYAITTEAADVLSEIAILEAKSEFLSGSKYEMSCKRLLAEALARTLCWNDTTASRKLINEVLPYIEQRNRELAKQWFYGAAYKAVLVLLVVFLASLFVREYHVFAASDIFLSGVVGGVGALMSMVTRTSKIRINAQEGEAAHILDGVSRIVAGCIGGFFISLLVKSGLIFGGVIFNGKEQYLTLALALVAGSSERFVPSLIEKVGGHPSLSEEKNV
jgi:hypothetical protein